MRDMAESEGKFGEWGPSDRKCGTCGAAMAHQRWESSDGAYEDDKYMCPEGHVEWVDGIDS
jgi:hypothetical protein